MVPADQAFYAFGWERPLRWILITANDILCAAGGGMSTGGRWTPSFLCLHHLQAFWWICCYTYRTLTSLVYAGAGCMVLARAYCSSLPTLRCWLLGMWCRAVPVGVPAVDGRCTACAHINEDVPLSIRHASPPCLSTSTTRHLSLRRTIHIFAGRALGGRWPHRLLGTRSCQTAFLRRTGMNIALRWLAGNRRAGAMFCTACYLPAQNMDFRLPYLQRRVLPPGRPTVPVRFLKNALDGRCVVVIELSRSLCFCRGCSAWRKQRAARLDWNGRRAGDGLGEHTITELPAGLCMPALPQTLPACRAACCCHLFLALDLHLSTPCSTAGHWAYVARALEDADVGAAFCSACVWRGNLWRHLPTPRVRRVALAWAACWPYSA